MFKGKINMEIIQRKENVYVLLKEEKGLEILFQRY